MNPQAHHGWLTVEQIGDVTVATFTRPTIRDEGPVRLIDEQLAGLIRGREGPRLLLDFSQVEYLSSALLGKLAGFGAGIIKAGGRLALCGLRPEIYRLFEVTRLDRKFEMYPDRQQAVQSLARP